MTDIRNVALALFKMIDSQPVEESLIQEAADYFASSESPVDPDTFRRFFAHIRKHLTEQEALPPLAARWKAQLAGRSSFSHDEAQVFHKEYVASLDMDTMITEAVTAGFAKRNAGTAFDYELSQPHKVTGWTLLYTTEGSATLRAGLREHRVRAHEALLFSPNAVYRLKREDQCPSWSHYWVVFQPQSTWRPHLEWPKIAPHVGCLNIASPQRDTIGQLMQSMLDCFSDASPLRHELAYNLMEQLILRCATLMFELPRPHIDDRIDKIQQHLDTHYREPFTLGEIADIFHLSASRLSALFKEETGVTVFGWRDEKRMIHAAQLLRGTDKSIAEISDSIGISDPAYFTRTFHRLVGSTPRDYRKGRGTGVSG
ncbi:MAG: AraC family transcriptional regulator of arabinose operon [Bermanella sp.]|jgi:AraC family transcriptional regulator of arabinose operon